MHSQRAARSFVRGLEIRLYSWNVVTPDASLVISMGADIASYPKRNCGCPCKSNHPNISPSFKVRAGIKLLNAGLCAYSLVLLTGDVSPGPANISQDSQNFSDIGFPSNRGLKIAHLNVRSITNKIDSLRLLLLNNPFDVLTISETWLTKNISDPELNIQGYSFVRNDRKSRCSGGCMIYIRDGLPYRARPDLQDENIESCVLELNRPKCKNMLIWSIYRAPDAPLPNFIDTLNSKISILPQDVELVLLGDFNVDVLAKRNTSGHSLKQKINLFASTNNLN